MALFFNDTGRNPTFILKEKMLYYIQILSHRENRKGQEV